MRGTAAFPSEYYWTRKTPWGPIAVGWSVHAGRPMIHRVLLSTPSVQADLAAAERFGRARVASCAEMDRIADGIQAFLTGADISFSLDGTRMDLCPAFQEAVLRAEHAIPRGAVTTYSRIAVHLGRPKAARAVGTALASNPFPIIIPCHRAIRSDGTPGGYQGGPEMKRRLLEMEGIQFDPTGRVKTVDIWYA